MRSAIYPNLGPRGEVESSCELDSARESSKVYLPPFSFHTVTQI